VVGPEPLVARGRAAALAAALMAASVRPDLRVLVVSHLYPLRREPGLGTFTVRELAHLATLGIESDVLIPRPWAPWPLHRVARWRGYGPDNRPAGPEAIPARTVRYPRPPGFWYRRWEGRVLGRRLLAPARQWHAQRGYRLVLAISMFPDADAATTVARALRLPLAALAIGSDVMVMPELSRHLRARLGQVVEQAELVAAVSQWLCRRLAEAGARHPLCVRISRDTRAFAPAPDRAALRRKLGWSGDEVVAIYVGALWEAKGIGDLAAVLPGLLRAHPRLRLVCVGEGALRGPLEQAAADAGAAERLLLTGHLPPERVPPYLQASDFLVFPSHSEGMPNAVLEAMNCGLPVIGTRVGGIPEAVIDGQTGLLVEARHPAQLRAALDRMATDAPFRHAAGQRALERVRRDFDPDANAARFAAALRKVADAAVRPPSSR
jgi:glycosyltransferase involved in cell wall biosynthesis